MTTSITVSAHPGEGRRVRVEREQFGILISQDFINDGDLRTYYVFDAMSIKVVEEDIPQQESTT